MTDNLFHGDIVSSRRIIYTPSEFAKGCLCYLQEIGELHAQKTHVSKRSNLSSYLFFIVVSGSGHLEYDNDYYSLCAGDCVFIDCKNPYLHETSDNLWTLKWIHFNGSNMPGIYAKYTSRGGIAKFHPETTKEYEEIWNSLYSFASSEDYIRDMRLNEKINLLLSLIMQESWNQDRIRTGSKKNIPNEVRQYIDENFANKITLDYLAEHYYINKFYLTRIFKSHFGISINTYITDKRITHAKHLLRFTDKSLEQIALDCGFGALYYFSRTFGRVEGISPSEYRKKW